MLQVGAIHIASEHPKELAAFYQKVLAQEPEWQNDQGASFLVGDFRLLILAHDHVHGKNAQPERLIYDLTVANVEADFKRIVALGASVVQEPYTFEDTGAKLTIATLADLDGNYFQLMSATPR